jgi:hypothetical protein
MLVLAGCEVGGSNQPLTVVEQRQTGAAGATGATGAAGATGATGAAGATPMDTVTGAAGAGVVSGGGTTGGGPACWANGLPPEPQAPQPRLAWADACKLAANATSWTFPTTWTGTNSIKNDDHNGDIVGRWLTCGTGMVVASPHAGIEFGGNGRWQLLTKDGNDALVPIAMRGYYYVLGNGQVQIADESSFGPFGAFVTFADGNRDVVRFDGGPQTNAIYARAAPSPTNGDDNVPSVSDGHCSMVGTWDVPATMSPPGAPASVWSFDEAGHFVVGAPSDDLCGPHKMWGTYRLATDFGFQLTSNWNLGQCDWWFTAAFPAKFSADCSTLTTVQMSDNCTGGRGYLNGTTVLRRR